MEIDGIAHIRNRNFRTVRGLLRPQQDFLLARDLNGVAEAHHLADNIGPRPRSVDYDPGGKFCFRRHDTCDFSIVKPNSLTASALNQALPQCSSCMDVSNCPFVWIGVARI